MDESIYSAEYDVVIVGSGIAGAIAALELGKTGKRVLLVEAGVALPGGREELVERFYLSTTKFPESPYGFNPNAPQATIGALLGVTPCEAHIDYEGTPEKFGSTYERRGGGTMWHWMGTSLRFLPEDFETKTRYGQAVDWPITYSDLGLITRRDGLSYYGLAEREIGVSADVKHQTQSPFEQGYRFPNPAIPWSRVDQFFDEGVKGMRFEDADVRVLPTPAGRNSRPYDNRRACAGNTNCVPICPIEAKYDPSHTLYKAFNTGNVHALFKHVATKLEWDHDSMEVTGVRLKRYEDASKVSGAEERVVRGRRYIVAANGIETPKLLLLSGLGDVNDSIGRYLMDHPFYLRWGVAPKPVHPYRGPLSTAGLDSLRGGAFRRHRAAYRVEIGNDGWGLAAQDPYASLLNLVESGATIPRLGQTTVPHGRLYGRALVEHLSDLYSRQVRIGFEIEQLPVGSNRVTLSNLRDGLGIARPKIHYARSDYDNAGLASAWRLGTELFARLGIQDMSPDAKNPEAFDQASCEAEKARIAAAGRPLVMGAGHLIGTYRMGKSKKDSVVDFEQRSWDCRNLFLLGSGVFPTSATGNPTLTLAALAYWAADTINRELVTG